MQRGERMTRETSSHGTLFLIFLLFSVFAFGMAGFKILFDLPWIDAFFYTVTTITTVGYEAPPQISPEGKLFVSMFLLGGIGVAGYAIANLTQHVLVRRVLMALGKRRDHAVNDLRNHWIVCGFGRVGQSIAEMLAREEAPFVVLEKDEDLCDICRQSKWHVVRGDAREESTLDAAGIGRAKGLIVCLDNDANNVYVVLSARAANAALHIVVRANENQSVNVLYRAGADKVLNPLLAAAAAMTRAALHPAVADFLELINISKKIDLHMDALKLSADSPFIEKALAETHLRSRYNLLVVAITAADTGAVAYNPPGTATLHPGDELILLGTREQIAAVRPEIPGSAKIERRTAEKKTSDVRLL